MYIYTVFITVAKVGTIWAKRSVVIKSFQTLGQILFMAMMLHLNSKKKKEIPYEKFNQDN